MVAIALLTSHAPVGVEGGTCPRIRISCETLYQYAPVTPKSGVPSRARSMPNPNDLRSPNQPSFWAGVAALGLRWPLGRLERPTGNWLQNYSIISTEANEVTASVHNRCRSSSSRRTTIAGCPAEDGLRPARPPIDLLRP